MLVPPSHPEGTHRDGLQPLLLQRVGLHSPAREQREDVKSSRPHREMWGVQPREWGHCGARQRAQTKARLFPSASSPSLCCIEAERCPSTSPPGTSILFMLLFPLGPRTADSPRQKGWRGALLLAASTILAHTFHFKPIPWLLTPFLHSDLSRLCAQTFAQTDTRITHTRGPAVLPSTSCSCRNLPGGTWGGFDGKGAGWLSAR